VTRRSIGRARLIVSLGATLILAGSLPAWWTVGGRVTEALSGNAFDDGSVAIVVFLAAVALLFIVVLPFATRDGEAGVDRPLSYGLVWLAAIVAFGARLYQINEFGGLGLPDRSPGLWLTALGLVIVAGGVVDMLGERPRDY
jgi:hypothetical protein